MARYNSCLHIDESDFIYIWETSDTKEEVADRLNVTVNAVSLKGSNLRRKGVALKDFERWGKPLPVHAANNLIDRIRTEAGITPTEVPPFESDEELQQRLEARAQSMKHSKNGHARKFDRATEADESEGI